MAVQSGAAILRRVQKELDCAPPSGYRIGLFALVPHSMKKMKTNPPDVHTFSSSADLSAKPYATQLMVQGVG
ncbi:MAG TPA: hypothetical protein VJ848_03755 [Candidatus Angelobacter sp.]|nr:hypothetical protein [Candidatus Angelobacter sp.]